MTNITSGSWASLRVWQPSVIKDETNYLMFYSGWNGSKFQIAQSTSIDGIIWSQNNNPLNSLLPNDVLSVHDPTILNNNGNYEMWYVSSLGGGSNFRIQRATKNINDEWIIDPLQPVASPSGSWDLSGLSSPFVLKMGDSYKMWYSGFSNSRWKIGYATSTDGITWVPYANNPIIDRSAFGQDADGASVIFNGTYYELFFHGINGNIMYTLSEDGITNWSTPVAVLTKGVSYDSVYMAGPSALRLSNGTTLLYYGGADATGTWRISMASDGPIPTPTPAPVSKVIVIPGMGGSWSNDLLLCDLDKSTNWVSTPKYGDIYNPLLQQIQEAGYQAIPYYYDWRQRHPYHASHFAQFLNGFTLLNGEKMYVVGHSMGGLVARSYIDQYGDENKIEKLITAGAPHRGSALAYPMLEAGEMWSDDFWMQFATVFNKKWCGGWLGDKDIIRNLIPSFYDVMPIDIFLTDQKTGLPIAINTMSIQNIWLAQDDFIEKLSGINFGTFSGNNHETLSSITVKDPSKEAQWNGNWIDGKPSEKEKSLSGDGTVLASSSLVERSTQFQKNLDHTQLVNSQEGIGTIFNFLGIATPSATINNTTSTSSIAIMAYPASFSITDLNGNEIYDTQGLIVVENPKKGAYKLTLQPKTSDSTRIAIAQFLPNGNVLWKDYFEKGIEQKEHMLHVDTEIPIEDLMQ